MSDRAREHVSGGRLYVPVADAMSPEPKRPGWRPCFVSVVLSDATQKVIVYRRA
jgi:hypothetical protein